MVERLLKFALILMLAYVTVVNIPILIGHYDITIKAVAAAIIAVTAALVAIVIKEPLIEEEVTK